MRARAMLNWSFSHPVTKGPPMPTDIEIARSVTPLPITEVAKNAGVDVKHLIPYGFDKA